MVLTNFLLAFGEQLLTSIFELLHVLLGVPTFGVEGREGGLLTVEFAAGVAVGAPRQFVRKRRYGHERRGPRVSRPLMGCELFRVTLGAGAVESEVFFEQPFPLRLLVGDGPVLIGHRRHIDSGCRQPPEERASGGENQTEREGLRRFVDTGGLLFSDDCNHDVNGLYATSFEAEMRRVFPEPGTLDKLPNSHPLYRSFFPFPDGPPETSHELNGWGDDMVHDYLRGVERRGRLGVLYSNKDYGCEWDYDWRNKRFRREDNTRFAVNIVVYAMT